ncbi:tRNA (adenine(58)-N(1))-methyltransferase catalytic subunit trm61 [Pseudocercospora fuligena]|uniref:tRNA (adenine(58)-N(1))-methyltransferase catalytic subunit TRM61 n=1 Tax=Pseudocercospora fuligena TaxID=685502 RepID=A0A8H6VLD8_9PEZI|nr:tRNA (adenine(58)-N(1))-methyltransferase catalytic subunit trm61 [Pseudocercospora fuligena]
MRLQSSADDGYAEGAVTNTRFGSFPHSTLIGSEWGSQVRASKVDTGTRGRKGKKAKAEAEESVAEVTEEVTGKKRKSNEQAQDEESPTKKRKQEQGDARDVQLAVKAPIEAGSGFLHVLQPTPESWTSSLDHRTQVVYTPDYSYILQRLRLRPGSTLIEAGAGSGSFTHAAARAVFSGYPSTRKERTGRVCSYEFHEPRMQTLRAEITDHGLDGIVHLTHRDVCNDGFLLADGTSPNTNAIFLDLPAPWIALRHLTRAGPNSPLDPETPTQLCTFSPCIEQVIATVSRLRKAGWADVSMVEVQHKRIDVRRERVGLKEEGLRGVNAVAADVNESIERLREVENKLAHFHALHHTDRQSRKEHSQNSSEGRQKSKEGKTESKAERLERIKREADERKLYKEGKLVHRSEPEMKTHTSYLVFAVLPREWSEEDEQKALEAYPVDEIMKGAGSPKAVKT